KNLLGRWLGAGYREKNLLVIAPLILDDVTHSVSYHWIEFEHSNAIGRGLVDGSFKKIIQRGWDGGRQEEEAEDFDRTKLEVNDEEQDVSYHWIEFEHSSAIGRGLVDGSFKKIIQRGWVE
nr:hypothetical protein [Tanacetum cinerariifolium]